MWLANCVTLYLDIVTFQQPSMPYLPPSIMFSKYLSGLIRIANITFANTKRASHNNLESAIFFLNDFVAFFLVSRYTMFQAHNLHFQSLSDSKLAIQETDCGRL